MEALAISRSVAVGCGALETAHVSPRRSRLLWRGAGDLPEEVTAALRRHPALRSVEYRPASRSLVLEHAKSLSGDQVRSLLRSVELPAARAQRPPAQSGSTREPSGLHVAHAEVSGRVRLVVASLRRRPRAAHRLELHLRSLPGVHAVTASTVTGSVLVHYDPARRSVADLEAEIARWLRLGAPAAPPLPEAAPSPAAAPASAAPRPIRPDREGRHWSAGLSVAQVLRRLDVPDGDGLTEDQVRLRMPHAGKALPVATGRPVSEILKDQFVSVPTAMLGAAMGVSFFTAGRLDALVIGAVLLLNGAIGYATERYAERAIEALRRLGFPQAHVVRRGVRRIIPAAELAHGDVIRLRGGDIVPADARVIEGTFQVNEAMLTGESEAAAKNPDPIECARSIHELRNIVFQGTMVLDGRGRAVVLATGQDTELGRIQGLVTAAAPPRTRLQEELDELGKSLGVGAGSVSGLLVGGGLARRMPWREMLQTGVSLAVSAVPEGLPAIATTALAGGMQRMLRQQVVIRKLPAVEALGSVTVLCVDKTGTLTLNRMTAARYWWEDQEFVYVNGGVPRTGSFQLGARRVREGDHPALDAMLRVGALCNEAKLRPEKGGLHVSGSATEGALLLAAEAGGHRYRELRRAWPTATLHRRDENRMRMATVHWNPSGGILVAVKGSAESVLELCTHRMDAEGKPVALSPDDRRRYGVANRRLAAEGLRVLGFAQGAKREEALHNGHLEGLTWLGLVGLEDPIRPGVAEAMARCREAGVRTVILTGDQHGTALAVARKLGLAADRRSVLDASELERMSAAEIAEAAERTNVFARVSPEDKLRIVQALQAAGEVVAMTGDGVNDGPALRAADIGVAMGDGSTDVARELADVVLTRNDFASLVAAVEQGRVIYTNIRRALRYLVSSNLSELMLAGVCLAAGAPFPFRPIQILWLNLVSDIFPALALVMEPSDRNVMRQPPRAPGSRLISRGEWPEAAGDAGILTAASLGSYLWAGRRFGFGPDASAVALTTVTIGQALHALACSGDAARGKGLPHAGLWACVLGTILLQVASNQWLRRLVGGAPLGRAGYAAALLGALAPFVVNMARKRRRAAVSQLAAPARPAE